MKFAFIRDHLAKYPLEICCRVLEVSRSGYYAWLSRPASARATRRQQIVQQVKEVYQQSKGRYGSPRVSKELLATGQMVNPKTVAKVMREQQMQAIPTRKFRPCTTDSDHSQPVAENLLDRQFTADWPNQKWLTDITYIATDQGWLYLAAVLDLYSRKIVGWSMADHLREELVSDAVRMAIHQRCPGAGLLHHSDRGVQYACEDYQQLLKDQKMQVSMSRRGNCWDNAAMESFWGTLKKELVYREQYATHDQARQSIFEYIEVFYNRKRLHSSLGYISPEAFEASLN